MESCLYVQVRLAPPATETTAVRHGEGPGARACRDRWSAAGRVVGAAQQKSPDGTRLLRKYSIPRNPTAKDARTRVLPDDSDPDTPALYAYNEQDIVAEACVSEMCPEIEGEELQYWLCDQAINYRGVAIDLEGVENCIAIIDEAHAIGNARLYELTGGAVARASEVARLTAWLHGQGVHMESLDEEHVMAALGGETE